MALNSSQKYLHSCLGAPATRREGGAVNRLEDYQYMLDVIMETLPEIQQENMIMDTFIFMANSTKRW